MSLSSKKAVAGIDGSLREKKSIPNRYWAVVSVLLFALLILVGCGGKESVKTSPTPERSDRVLQIAEEYESDGDIDTAREELKALGIAEPGSFAAELATEYERREGASSEKAKALAKLALGLGYRDDEVALLAGEKPSPSPEPKPFSPTPTAIPTSTPTSSPSPTPTPKPIVVAQDRTNVRTGPGKVYPPVAHLKPGESALITGEGPYGKWWRIQTKGGKEGWVFKGVVATRGQVSRVEKISDIPPTPRPTFTPTPAATPTPTIDFVVTKQRLWTVEENGGSVDHGSVRCGYKHQIYVTVVDKNGKPIDGVVVERIYAKTRGVSGTKGPGRLVFSLFSHGDKLRVVGDVSGHTFTSQITRNLDVRDERIPIKDLIAAHYCTDPVTCQHLIDTNHLCRGHYSWSVVFQRQW